MSRKKKELVNDGLVCNWCEDWKHISELCADSSITCGYKSKCKYCDNNKKEKGRKRKESLNHYEEVIKKIWDEPVITDILENKEKDEVALYITKIKDIPIEELRKITGNQNIQFPYYAGQTNGHDKNYYGTGEHLKVLNKAIDNFRDHVETRFISQHSAGEEVNIAESELIKDTGVAVYGLNISKGNVQNGSYSKPYQQLTVNFLRDDDEHQKLYDFIINLENEYSEIDKHEVRRSMLHYGREKLEKIKKNKVLTFNRAQALVERIGNMDMEDLYYSSENLAAKDGATVDDLIIERIKRQQ